MRKIVEMQFGSHVYGTNIPTSDHDFKALAIPARRDIILQRAPKTISESTSDDTKRNTQDDVDQETFALHYFMKLLTEGQTVCLDMLFTPTSFYKGEVSPLWEHIKSNQDKLITKKMSAFAGYCQAQAAKYSLKGSNLSAYEAAIEYFGQLTALDSRLKIKDTQYEILMNQFIDTPVLNGKETPLIQIVKIKNNKGVEEEYLQVGPKTKVPLTASVKLAQEIFQTQYDRYGERAKMAQANEGIDWKALMHAVRVCHEAIELCKTGTITFPRPEKDLLLKIRKGELAYNAVAEMIETGLVELTDAKNKSNLPEKPDFKWIEEFILEVYDKQAI